MTPEEEARQVIDELLKTAGWKVQDYRKLNLGASLGVAVREFPLKTSFADYMLFVDRKAAGVIEAEPSSKSVVGLQMQLESTAQFAPLFQLPARAGNNTAIPQQTNPGLKIQHHPRSSGWPHRFRISGTASWRCL